MNLVFQMIECEGLQEYIDIDCLQSEMREAGGLTSDELDAAAHKLLRQRSEPIMLSTATTPLPPATASASLLPTETTSVATRLLPPADVLSPPETPLTPSTPATVAEGDHVGVNIVASKDDEKIVSPRRQRTFREYAV